MILAGVCTKQTCFLKISVTTQCLIYYGVLWHILHEIYAEHWSKFFFKKMFLHFIAIQEILNVVLITLYPHNAEPWCLSAAHEVAILISGSRWRASDWEAQSGSMYVITKRMTLAEAQLFNHKKHTLSVLFRFSFCTSLSFYLSLCLSHTQLPCFYTFLYAVLQLETIYTPPQYHFIKKSRLWDTEAQRLLQYPYKEAISYWVMCNINHSGWSVYWKIKMFFGS